MRGDFMKLKDFISKINFMDNNYYFRFYFDKNIVYVSATDLKEEGITGIIHSLSMDIDIEYDGNIDISNYIIKSIDFMSTPLMISIELVGDIYD